MTTLLLTYAPSYREEGLTLEQQADLEACKEQWSRELDEELRFATELERIMRTYYEYEQD